MSDHYDNELLAARIISGDKQSLESGQFRGCEFSREAIINLRNSDESLKPLVLDFGGGGGRCGYFSDTELFEKWVVLETPSMVNSAKEILALSSHVFVHSTDEVAKISTSFDILHISSALQYTPCPYEVLEQLLRFSPKVIIFEKLVLTESHNAVMLNQYSLLRDNIPNPPKSLRFWTLAARYPLHAMAREKFLGILEPNYKVRSFQIECKQSHLPLFRGLNQYTILAERI